MMRENISEVITGAEFLDQPEEEVMDYISDHLVTVENEDVLFEALIAWTYVNKRARGDAFKKLLPQIRLEHCTPDFLCNVVKKEPLMKNPDAMLLLIDAMSFQLALSHGTDDPCPKVHPRPKPNAEDLVLIGRSGFLAGSSLWVLDKDSSSWELLEGSSWPPLGKDCSVCVIPGGIMFTGGLLDGGTIGDCWLFQIKKQKWEGLPLMNSTRKCHGSIFYRDSVFVVGGLKHDDDGDDNYDPDDDGGDDDDGDENDDNDADEFLEDVEKFDLKSNRWHLLKPLNTPSVCCPLLLSCGRDVFLFGGHVGGNFVNETYKFNYGASKWEKLADMPWNLSNELAGTCIEDKIYIHERGSSTFMSFHPSDGQWTSLAEPSADDQLFAAAEWKGKILFASSSALREYDPKTDSWKDSDIGLPPDVKLVSQLLNVVRH